MMTFDDLLLLRGSQVISKKLIRLKTLKGGAKYFDFNSDGSCRIVGAYSRKAKYDKNICIDKGKILFFVQMQKVMSSGYYDNDSVILMVTDKVKHYTIIYNTYESIFNCFRFESGFPNNALELFQYENSTVSGIV